MVNFARTAVLAACAALGGVFAFSTFEPARAAPVATAALLDISQADAEFGEYRFRNGQNLPDLRLHHATVGTPHRDGRGQIDNAVLALHWTSASSQALLSSAFQTGLYAPGAPLDARRCFLILPDAIGHGHGQSSKPSDGLKASFPHYGYGDMVDLQHKLVTEWLGISHLRAIIGMSMGCMNAWQWAGTYPDAMDGVMPVACFPSAISGRNLLWRRMAADLIRSDAAWAGGVYAAAPRSAQAATEILRLMIDGVPHLQTAASTGRAADGYLADIKAQSRTMDANDLLYSLESSADFDAASRLAAVRTRVLAVNFADDEFYRDSLHLLQQQASRVPNATIIVRPVFAMPVGHLTTADPDLWADSVRAFMTSLPQSDHAP